MQVLVSPGIDHHDTVCDAALEDASQWADGYTGEASSRLFEALSPARLPIIASSNDLSLEEVDSFLAALERMGEEIAGGADEGAPAEGGAAGVPAASDAAQGGKDRCSSRVPRNSTSGGGPASGYRSGVDDESARGARDGSPPGGKGAGSGSISPVRSSLHLAPQ